MSLLRSCARQAQAFLRLMSFSARRLQVETPEPQQLHSDRPRVPELSKPKPSFSGRLLPQLDLSPAELERTRMVPVLPTYFGGNPIHDQNMSRVEALIRKHHKLPTRTFDSKSAQEIKYITLDEYKERTQAGTRVKGIHLAELVKGLNRLRSIEPELMPPEVQLILDEFTRQTSEDSFALGTMRKTLDEFGRANVVGKRKDAAAYVSMARGEGAILVNGKPLTEYFTKFSDSAKLVFPFQVVAQEARYNVFITASGGGISGQAEACMYGIAKALVVFNPLLKPRLRKAGLMTRDSRIVERKKPGKVKARKSPTWVKR